MLVFWTQNLQSSISMLAHQIKICQALLNEWTRMSVKLLSVPAIESSI